MHSDPGRRHRRRHHPEHPHGGMRNFFRHGPGGRAARRGNVRNAILALLADAPMHGYQVITELESRTGGQWRPSAGSVYPTLQQLEDEGLVSSDLVEGRRTYSLTDAGRTTAAELPASSQPWLDPDLTDAVDLRRQARGLIDAAVQVRRMGSPTATKAATEVLTEARRRLYAILAEDGSTEA